MCYITQLLRIPVAIAHFELPSCSSSHLIILGRRKIPVNNKAIFLFLLQFHSRLMCACVLVHRV